MEEHPLIGFRASPAGTRPYVLGPGRDVWELVEVVRARGSTGEAARLLGFDEELIQAAVDYHNRFGSGSVPLPAPGLAGKDRQSALQVATQLVGTLAAITTIVYLAGALVLALRLAFVHLPWYAVVGQLPREFILSTGVAQVLAPILVLLAGYGTYRLARGTRPREPGAPRWREDRRRGLIVLKAVGIGASLVLPAAAYVVREQLRDDGLQPSALWLLLAWLLLAAFSFAAMELRGLVAAEFLGRWNTGGAVAAVAGAYAVALVPALVVFSAALPLQEAKVCTTTAGFEEFGDLVGQGSDSVYLGERVPKHRRIAVFPRSQVEELFIGPKARRAQCDPRSARSALKAEALARDAQQAAAATRTAAKQAQGATAPRLPKLAAATVVAAAKVTSTTRQVAHDAIRINEAAGAATFRAAEGVDNATRALARAAARRSAAPDRIRAAARVVASAATAAAVEAHQAARILLQEARKAASRT